MGIALPRNDASRITIALSEIWNLFCAFVSLSAESDFNPFLFE
jgi:hypothetical protein